MSSPFGAEEIRHSPFSCRRENSNVDWVPGLVELYTPEESTSPTTGADMVRVFLSEVTSVLRESRSVSLGSTDTDSCGLHSCASASVRKDLATEKLLPAPAPAARKPRTISETLSPGSGPSGIRALLAAGSPESSSMCPTGEEVGIDEQPTNASEAHTDRISIVTRDPLDLMLVITVLLRGRPHRSRPCRPRRELPDRHPHRSCPCRRRLPSHRVRHRGRPRPHLGRACPRRRHPGRRRGAHLSRRSRVRIRRALPAPFPRRPRHRRPAR